MSVPVATRVTPELQENGRYRYEDTDEPVASIAADLGVTKRTFYVLVRRWGWRLRRNRPPRDIPDDLRLLIEAEQAVRAAATAAPAAEARELDDGAPPASAVTDAPQSADLSCADRLERAVETQLAGLENMRAQLGPLPQALADAERIARTLERLTGTLFNVRRLRSANPKIPGYARDADLPDDADAFREALASRIEILVRSRDAEDGS